MNFINEHKYLFVIIANEKSDFLYIKWQVTSEYTCGNSLIKLFRHCSNDVKVKWFKTYCDSFYRKNLWGKYTKETLRKVKCAYNMICRNVMKV